MRFYMNILATYFPDRDPPYDVYYQQILEQIELAEELGWECFRAGRKGYDIMTVGHPHPPDTVRPGVEAWQRELKAAGIDPDKRRCQFHIRTFVDEDARRAHEVATEAIKRYDEISRIGRREDAKPKSNDWEGMLASGQEPVRQSGSVHSDHQ